MALYEPYGELFPRKQARLLCLWDDLGIPHKWKKQVFGPNLACRVKARLDHCH
ncbi:hypothetical protein BT96DRAFT_495295 [Gymnopus androsaceus JB14]|uniref:Uncharacterized protein n=1 Tax=Gymnopus androsaceus JB14 TaxID=1447944 RepID=A0A6A4I1Q4_9AGAR|nr:hypothetical protein BT96DRAFT_495295 [Gymnopus androsaceus JB14]